MLFEISRYVIACQYFKAINQKGKPVVVKQKKGKKNHNKQDKNNAEMRKPNTNAILFKAWVLNLKV
jgi:hypothetical protein